MIDIANLYSLRSVDHGDVISSEWWLCKDGRSDYLHIVNASSLAVHSLLLYIITALRSFQICMRGRTKPKCF